MKTSTRILLGIICFILMFGVGLGIFYLVDTPKFNQLFGIAQEQPVDPDIPVDPENPSPDDTEEQKLITDFQFSGNSIIKYIGNDSKVIIPKSYSKKDEYVETFMWKTYEDIESEENYNWLMENYYNPLKLITKDNIIFEGNNFDEAFENMFEACEDENDLFNFFPIKIDVYKSTYYEGTDYIIENIEQSVFENNAFVTEIELPSTITKLNYGQFQNCTNLVKINIPEGITEIPSYCFYNTAIENIVFPDSLISLGQYSFANTKLSSIDFNNVQNFEYMSFANTMFENVIIPETIQNYGYRTFSGENLKTVVILGNINSDQLGSLIDGNSDGKLLSVNYYVKDDLIETIFEQKEFSNFCWNYTCNIFPYSELENPKPLEELVDFVINDTHLISYQGTNSEIILPSSYKYYIDDEGITHYFKGLGVVIDYVYPSAFVDNNFIEKITIPEGYKYLGDNAFNGCTNLKTLILPSTIESLGYVSLQFNGDVLCYSNKIFNNSIVSPVLGTQTKFYVLDEYYEQCQQDSYWSQYINQIYKISEYGQSPEVIQIADGDYSILSFLKVNSQNTYETEFLTNLKIENGQVSYCYLSDFSCVQYCDSSVNTKLLDYIKIIDNSLLEITILNSDYIFTGDDIYIQLRYAVNTENKELVLVEAELPMANSLYSNTEIIDSYQVSLGSSLAGQTFLLTQYDDNENKLLNINLVENDGKIELISDKYEFFVANWGGGIFRAQMDPNDENIYLNFTFIIDETNSPIILYSGYSCNEGYFTNLQVEVVE